MNCRNAVVVFDPSEKLPSYGENGISISYDGSTLVLSVFFDGTTESDSKISVVFENVCYTKISSAPGVDDTVIRYEKYANVRALVEFQYSDFKDQWEKNFNGLFILKHLKIFFLSANKSLEVICESFRIESAS